MAKIKRAKRILFFTAGIVPTDEEQAEFEALGSGAAMRRADLVRTDEALEAFDEVAGAVPPNYQAKADELAGLPAPKEPPKADPAAVKQGSPVAPPKPPVAATGGGWKPNA